MASLSSEKLKEMEAEMNRFEQEILTPGMGKGDVPRMIIGSNTFTRVQAQLQATKTTDPDPPSTSTSASAAAIPLSVLTAPPPPPPSASSTKEPSATSNLFLPPPPPPPVRLSAPSFVPPQLRHRNPGPPLHRPPIMMPMRPPMPYGHHPMQQMGPPPMGMHPMPPMMPPSGPGPYGLHSQPMMYSNNSTNGDNSSYAEATSALATIEKPKVVYSAAPIRKAHKAETIVTESKPIQETEAYVETGHIDEDLVETSMAPTLTESVVSELDQMDVETLTGGKKEKKEKKRKYIRTAAGTVWEDPTLAEWDTDDFRMFCGDLGNEVTDETLARAFVKYPTFVKAKVIRDRRSNKTKGYGFVSFKDPNDFSRAMREMNGKYVGNRPIKLRKSSWKDRNVEVVKKKEKEKKRLGLR